MITLFIDTSTDKLNVALIKDDSVLGYNTLICSEHSKHAMREIEKLFKSNNISPKEVNKIMVTNGPGSFTGIRIGVAIAKTYAWSLNINIVPLSTLKTFALSNSGYDYYVPFIDARRGYVYAGVYDKEYNEVIPDSYILFDDLIKKIENLSNFVFIGKTNNLESVISPSIDIEKVYNFYKNDEGISAHKLLPNYLKKTEAEESVMK